MITSLRIQQILKPYHLDSNNKLEFNEIITGTFTIFSSIVFNDHEDKVSTIDTLVFLAGILYSSLKYYLVLIVNARFILIWLYYMLKIQKYQVLIKLSELLRKVLCIKSENTQNHATVNQYSKLHT